MTSSAARDRTLVQIRVVLNTLWDPIGVTHDVDDEYDRYARRVHKRLLQGADDRKISDYLLKLETSSMGLPGSSEESRMRVVEALRDALDQ